MEVQREGVDSSTRREVRAFHQQAHRQLLRPGGSQLIKHRRPGCRTVRTGQGSFLASKSYKLQKGKFCGNE